MNTRTNGILTISSRKCLLALLAVIAVSADATAKPNKEALRAPMPSDGVEITTPQGYRIGAGDVLQISVWKEPEASVPAVTVRSDGVISLPLIKEIQVVGLTPRELEHVLIEKLASIIREADVTVVVKEIHSEKIYLIGGVRKEGPLVLNSPLTLVQAVAAAGGFTDYAKRKKVYVLRQNNGKQDRIPVNYEAVIKGDHPQSNILLRPGDTVVIPQ